MSIKGSTGELVRLPGMWEVAAKFAIAAQVPMFMLLVSWGVWITMTVHQHTTELAVLKDRSGRGISQSVSVGHVDAATEAADASGKTYLTVAEVAKREHIAERTLISWIEQGRLEPPPTKEGKAWIVAAEYRIKPPNAAESGSE